MKKYIMQVLVTTSFEVEFESENHNFSMDRAKKAAEEFMSDHRLDTIEIQGVEITEVQHVAR